MTVIPMETAMFRFSVAIMAPQNAMHLVRMLPMQLYTPVGIGLLNAVGPYLPTWMAIAMDMVRAPLAV
jgi:hypothetical protein